MKQGLKQKFMERWNKYFPEIALPIAFYCTENPMDESFLITEAWKT
jgi:hypothetical protein